MKCDSRVAMKMREVLASLAVLDRPSLLGRVRRRAGAGVDAEDVVHDAVVVALERGSELREPARAAAWLGRITDRKAIDARRATARQRARTRLCSVDVAAEPARPDPCGCVRVLARALRPHHATILLRVDEQGASLAEVATELGLTKNAVTVRLCRARAELRAELARHCGATSVGACQGCACVERSCCPPIDEQNDGAGPPTGVEGRGRVSVIAPSRLWQRTAAR